MNKRKRISDKHTENCCESTIFDVGYLLVMYDDFYSSKIFYAFGNILKALKTYGNLK